MIKSMTSTGWPDEKDQFLVETHSTLTASEQARQLGIGYSAVIRRRMKLYQQGRISLSARASLPPWSDEEEEFLRDHYSRMTLNTLANRLGRSPRAIRERRGDLGLHRTDGFYTASALAEIFGMPEKKLILLVKQGWFKGSRARYNRGPHRPWRFCETNIRRFIRTYPWLLRPEKMDKHYFRALLRREWKRDPWLSAGEAAAAVGCRKYTLIRAARAGVIRGWQRSPTKNSKWWFRKSDLAGFWEKLAARKAQVSKEARHSYLLHHGSPVKVNTIWELLCPACGELYRVEAPPKAYGEKVLELAARQHQCDGHRPLETSLASCAIVAGAGKSILRGR